MGKVRYDLTGANKETLEKFSNKVLIDEAKGNEVALKGEHYYSQLLTENILLQYFEEFKNDPWGSYLKYFKNPTNVYPIKAVMALENRDINKQVYIRNDVVMDALLLGYTPGDLNMKNFDALVPAILDNETQPRLVR